MKNNDQFFVRLTALGAVGFFLFGNSAAMASNLSMSDRSFMTKAAQAGLAEVQDARVAEHRTHNDKVSAFARQMVSDHEAINESLMALAQNKGVELPNTPTLWQRHVNSKLSNLSGTDLDRAYVKEELKDHQEAVNLFSEEAHNAQNDDVRHFAEKNLPTLRAHLQEIQKINDEMGG